MRSLFLIPAAAALLLVLAAAAVSAQSADPNAAIFYNVIQGCTTKDPSWSVNTPLHSWAGAHNCPGPNCWFSVTGKCNGPLNLTNLTGFHYFSSLNFASAGLTGTVDLTQLPSGLATFDLRLNGLTGTIDLTTLPASLMFFYISNNGLTGALDLTRLPANLILLHLNNNAFTGTVDFTRFGASSQLNELFFNNNLFTGTPDLTALPTMVEDVRLHNNSFTGTVSVNATNLRNRGVQFDLSSNPLFAVWMTRFSSGQDDTLTVDPTVLIHTTTIATESLGSGFYTSPQVTRPLLLFATGYAVIASCQVRVPSGLWQVTTDGTNYVADSGAVVAALAPCLPTTFGTPQYFMHLQYFLQPSNETLLLVTNGAQNITFTRRAG